jgi:hypothetical protein
LEEAQSVAKELKNESVMADILNTQGNVLFYRGDPKGAKNFNQRGLQLASRAKDEDRILISKLNIAKADTAMRQTQAAASSLRQLATQADVSGRTYLAVLCSIALAEANIAPKPDARGHQELEQLLGKSERLGVRMESARIHYLLGRSLRATGDAGAAAGQYRQTLTILDDVKREPGAEHLLDRFDLKAIYDEATIGARQQSK